MMGDSRRDPLRFPVAAPAVGLAAAGSALLGFRLGIPWLLPVLNAAPAWAVMALSIRRGKRAETVALMLLWAAALGAATTILCAADPFGTASAAVLHGPAYADEMRAWIATGAGCESEPSCFVPRHLLHAGAFVALALLTAGAGAILMGSVLMNYMAFYVGTLAAASAAPGTVAILGWHPWSVVRIAAFVTLGVILAEPLLGRLGGRPSPPGRSRWLVAGAGGLVADMVIKALLAPSWAALLRGWLLG